MAFVVVRHFHAQIRQHANISCINLKESVSYVLFFRMHVEKYTSKIQFHPICCYVSKNLGPDKTFLLLTENIWSWVLFISKIIRAKH